MALLSRLLRPAALVVLAPLLLLGLPASSAAAAAPVHAYFVQGVPNVTVDVRLDGKTVGSNLPAKKIVGPVDMSPGTHKVTFTSKKWTISSNVHATGRSQDIVVHWPADSTMNPEVTVFQNKVAPVPSGKGRVTVAHTAVVPPADVVVSGKVLFSNIANGEFVTAEVPASTYPIEVVPTGGKKPLLGPVDLPVKAGALTRVFAIGAPKNGSMDAVVQVLPVATSGSGAPASMDAGSAGLVAPARHHLGWLPLAALAVLVGAAYAVGWRRHARR